MVATKPASLIGGPQDGAKVHPVGGVLSSVLYVGRVWQGDGFAAWSREWSERFPMKYAAEADGRRLSVERFMFRGDHVDS
jgi:hypothetical protein